MVLSERGPGERYDGIGLEGQTRLDNRGIARDRVRCGGGLS